MCVFVVVHLEHPEDRRLGLWNGPLTPSTCALHVQQPIHLLFVPQISVFSSLISTLKMLYGGAIGAWNIHLSKGKSKSAAVAPAPTNIAIADPVLLVSLPMNNVLPQKAMRSSTIRIGGIN